MNLNQVTLPSTDVERAAKFYRELGFVQIVDSAPRYARFECPDGGSTFSLHQVDALQAGHGAVVYFECSDLDARYEALVKRGIRFESPPTDQRWLWREAYLRDPDGNLLCLYFAGGNRRFPPWRIGAEPGAASSDPAGPVQRQLDAYNAHDLERFVAEYAEDIQVFRPPATDPVLSGKKAFGEHYARNRFNLPNLHARLVDRIVSGNIVVDQEDITGLSDGHVAAVAIYKVVDGRIQAVWFF